LLFANITLSQDDSKIDGPVIGIDLGTTYSCVGICKNGRVEIIVNELGNRITPSWVAFDQETKERLIGEAAKNQSALNPMNTVFDAKRLIGRKFSEKTVQEDMKLLPYSLINKDGRPYINIPVMGRDYSPEEISSMVLSKMKKIAED